MSNVNLNHLNGYYNFNESDKKGKKPEEQAPKEDTKVQGVQASQASAEAVLDAMSAMGLQNVVHNNMIDTKKYVDDESAARIAESMAAFEQFMGTAEQEGVPQVVAEQAALRFIS